MAAMVIAGALVGALGFEMLSAARAQTPDIPDTAQAPPDQSSATGVTSRSPEASRMLQRAEREGSIRTIVGLRTEFVPEGRLNRAAAAAQRRSIENVGQGLRAELAGTGFGTMRDYDTVPYIALSLSPRAFRAVQNSPRVTTIQEDIAVPATLEESAPVVQAPTMWTNGYTGTGKAIAILDTGVDADHSFFGDRVVAEACFSTGSDCPNGMATQTGGTVTKRRINIADAANVRPPNDGFSFPRDIVGSSVSVSGPNGGINGAATRESGEPDHLPADDASLGENSVWYRWTAPTSGRVFLNTCTTNIGTILAVYLGGSLGSLSQIDSNQDGDGCAEGSRLSFNAVEGRKYSIAVATPRSRNEGSFVLKLDRQPPPTADYELFNSLESSARGTFGVPPLADIGPGTNTFATATVDGDSRPVLTFPQGNGVQAFTNSGVLPDNAYTIVALFEFDSASGFNRIVDFKNGTSDNGLYVQDGELRFFPNAQRGTNPIRANKYVQVVFTRNSAGAVAGYVNGVRQFTFTDTSGDAVIGPDDVLRFFKDNTSGAGTGEESAGSVARIRLYDFALTAGEVSDLDRQDTIPPRVTSTDPANSATPTAEVKATFSDPMRANSINTTSFTLRKAGTTDAIPATVTYIATVTSRARELAGNGLDQNPDVAGDQPKTWRFTVSP